MISCLKGWSGEEGQPLVDRVLVAGEGLVLGDDGAHLGVDALEVVVAEVGAAGQFEVVVEAVLDRRADGVLGPGPEPRDGLGQHVGVEWRSTSRPRSLAGVTIETVAPSGSGVVRSVNWPSTTAARASLASALADRRGEVARRRAFGQ
jgi:hypothetical protein